MAESQPDACGTYHLIVLETENRIAEAAVTECHMPSQPLFERGYSTQIEIEPVCPVLLKFGQHTYGVWASLRYRLTNCSWPVLPQCLEVGANQTRSWASSGILVAISELGSDSQTWEGGGSFNRMPGGSKMPFCTPLRKSSRTRPWYALLFKSFRNWSISNPRASPYASKFLRFRAFWFRKSRLCISQNRPCAPAASAASAAPSASGWMPERG